MKKGRGLEGEIGTRGKGAQRRSSGITAEVLCRASVKSLTRETCVKAASVFGERLRREEEVKLREHTKSGGDATRSVSSQSYPREILAYYQDGSNFKVPPVVTAKISRKVSTNELGSTR